jgi:hypothetical protein
MSFGWLIIGVSAWLLRVELCYPERECDQFSWSHADPPICYHYNSLLFFFGLGGIGALAISLFFAMLFLPFSARAIIRMHTQRRDICRFGLRPFAAGWAINGICNAAAMSTWRWGCYQQLLDNDPYRSWQLTNEFYLCSSPTVGAVIVLGWVFAERYRRNRLAIHRRHAARLPAIPLSPLSPIPPSSTVVVVGGSMSGSGPNSCAVSASSSPTHATAASAAASASSSLTVCDIGSNSASISQQQAASQHQQDNDNGCNGSNGNGGNEATLVPALSSRTVSNSSNASTSST